jgi:DNA-binding NarL/FixJ family response regulator
MRKKRGCVAAKPSTSTTGTRILVVSQHEGVRRQLVFYLGLSPSLAVSGDAFSPEAIVRIDPDVVVLDLSRLGQAELLQALDAVRETGARLIALASIREPADERSVTEAGGLYRLKSAGADGLAETVRDLASQTATALASRSQPA